MKSKELDLIDQIPDQLGNQINRREFIKTGTMASCAALCPLFLSAGKIYANSDSDDSKFIREASYYEKLDHKKIRCLLCPRECVVDDRERGYCGVRENRGGTYYTLVY
ncbi:MAG: radical SAM protein, partial [Calditrichaceae bacterium]